MSRSLWTHFKLQIAFVATAGMLLSGCATTGSSMLDNNASPDPRLTQSSDAEFFSKSGYQACAVGAGIGILSCALSNSSNKAVCAVAAGITACGVAMGANYYLDQRRSEYADTTGRSPRAAGIRPTAPWQGELSATAGFYRHGVS